MPKRRCPYLHPPSFWNNVPESGVSYGLFLILTEQGLPITPMLAVAGLVGGELVSMIFSLLVILWDYRKAGYRLRNLRSPGTDMKEILAFSFPLTLSRLLVNILHSIESVLIPGHLRLYGLDNGSALSIYGVLTGMALPLILLLLLLSPTQCPQSSSPPWQNSRP